MSIYVKQNLVQFTAGLDSALVNQFFYFNLHISDIFKFSQYEISEKLLDQLEHIAQTPFQQNLVNVNKELLKAHKNKVQTVVLHTLPEEYSVFFQNLFLAYQYKIQSECGFRISANKFEQCKSEIYKYAPNDEYKLHALGYIGEAYFWQKNWVEAKTYLNYLVKDGFNINSNDPVLLTKLTLALYNEKTQIKVCNWILKQLRKKYKYVSPLLDNTKFLISAKYSK